MEYKAEDFISFIENSRRDKISPNALDLIAKRFRELECEVSKLSLSNVNVTLPNKDEVISHAYDKANNSEYNRRRVIRDEDDDLYYTGWLDCFCWLSDNER